MSGNPFLALEQAQQAAAAAQQQTIQPNNNVTPIQTSSANVVNTPSIDVQTTILPSSPTKKTSPSNGTANRIVTLSNFSPISTLERQYSTSNSNRLFIAVACNSNCCISLEQLFKYQKESGGSAAIEQQNTAAATVDNTYNSTSNGNNTDDNPFSFLNSTSSTTTNDNTTTTSGQRVTRKPSNNIGRFLKKVAATGTKAIERGMHQLAVKADQGRTPDHIVIAVYDNTSNTMNSTGPTLLFVTEPEPITAISSSGTVQFRIPLVVIDYYNNSQQQTIVLKLWVRSGAALVSSKYYLLAESSPIHTSTLRDQLYSTNQQQHNKKYININIPLISPLVVDGMLYCTVFADNKIPKTTAPGWSLQDPNPTTAYKTPMFHLPLDQTYVFPTNTTNTANNNSVLLLSTERSIESTVVLPLATAFTTLAAKAARQSLYHCAAMRQMVLEHRHDAATGEEYADVTIRISHMQTNMTSSTTLQNKMPAFAITYQRPNAIFEVEIMNGTRLPLYPTAADGFRPDIACRFYPKPVREPNNVLPSVLQTLPGRTIPSNGFVLGNIRLLVIVPTTKSSSRNSGETTTTSTVPENPFDTPLVSTEEVWDCVISLDSFTPSTQPQRHPNKEYTLYDRSGHIVGSIVLSLQIQIMQSAPQDPQQQQQAPNMKAAGGLVHILGLSNMNNEGLYPPIDFDQSPPNANDEMKRYHTQLSTMGYFITHAYLDQHVNTIRTKDVESLEGKARTYRKALLEEEQQSEVEVPSHTDRTPRPFRPSSSRTTSILSGIGFNVHTASFTLEVVDQDRATGAGAVFHNITCGAPADHARGFKDVFASTTTSAKDKELMKDVSTNTSTVLFNSPIGPVSGGLRRLETMRKTLTKEVANEQTLLANAIVNFFTEERTLQQQHQQYQQRPVTHVSARNAGLQGMRWRVFEAMHCLHHLTWICAMRRASVFSQALGIAVSSYLSAISDVIKIQSTWPELWARHGYLVSFEGLLSAAGKELGMIEDASIGIEMLRMVRIMLVPDDGSTANHPDRVPVPHSQYLRWVHIWPTTPQNPVPNFEMDYILQIGIVPGYFEQRVPKALRGGVTVRLYPLLFEVGVDIFQAASNASSNMSKVRTTSTDSANKEEAENPKDALSDDEDDATGITDDDELVQLNYEAFQKMNVYAQSVSPANPIQATPTRQTHPMLANLYQHIVSSAGKVNHDILDEAATLAQQLGGGGVVFCKSGKDRTAMHLTFKQAQFASRFRRPNSNPDQELEESIEDTTLDDARLIRLYGTRLPICEKNVGQAKYAFNSLQVKFMPDALKPPQSALAGFLKGGAVFGKGGIES